MKNNWEKIKVALSATWRLHLGIQAILVLLIIFSISYVSLRDILLRINEGGHLKYDPNSLLWALFVGCISSVVSAISFGLAGAFLWNWVSKMKFTGNYDVFIVERDENGEVMSEEPWGESKVLYCPLSGSGGDFVPVKLELTHDDVVLSGEGKIINNTYMFGHYTEVGDIKRRRGGSFTYEINGAGDTWSGHFVFIAPDDENERPSTGEARWVRR